MKTQRRRVIALASIAGAGLLALTSCGLGSAPEATTDTEGAIEGTIRFQTMQLSPTFDEYINGVIAQFEEEHPGTTVEWTDIPSESAARKVSADSVAGSLPDVLDLDTDTLAALGRDGRVLDMAEVAPELESDFVPSAWESFDFGATQVAALPWYLNTPVLYVNTTVLESAGLDSDSVPSSIDELLAVSEQIAASTDSAGFQPTAIGLPHMLLSSGVPLVNDDASEAQVDTPEAVDLINTLAELYRSGGIPADAVTAQQRSEIQTFQEGQTAFLESGPSRVRIIEENAPGLIPSISLAPPLGAASQTAWVVAHGLAVPKSSENQATALAFAEFLASPEMQLDFATQSSIFPSTAESLEDPFFTAEPTDLTTEARSIAGASLLEGKTIAKNPAVDAEYTDILWSHVQTAILGEIPAEEALSNAEAELTAVLQERNQ